MQRPVEIAHLQMRCARFQTGAQGFAPDVPNPIHPG
jgi:hypothetical protein